MWTLFFFACLDCALHELLLDINSSCLLLDHEPSTAHGKVDAHVKRLLYTGNFR